jgi:hypothetical protein
MENTEQIKKLENTVNFAADLRLYADIIERVPEQFVDDNVMYIFLKFTTKEAFVAAMLSIGGKWDKCPSGDTFYLEKKIGTGRVQLHLSIGRESVCVKKQVGTRKVKRAKPVIVEKPAVITPVEFEEVEEPIYEFDCNPILISHEPKGNGDSGSPDSVPAIEQEPALSTNGD